MNPFQKNKVDVSALTPEEQKAFRMYGKLPNRKDVLQNKLKERKYFDSGDYALSKAGATSEISPTDVGREHPVPENIPHLSSSPSQTSSVSGSIPSSGERSASHERTGSTSAAMGIPGATSSSSTGLTTSTSATGGPSFNAPTGGSSVAAAMGLSTGHTSMGMGQANSGSPVKEGSFLSRETSIDEEGREVWQEQRRESIAGVSPDGGSQMMGVPIRGRPGS